MFPPMPTNSPSQPSLPAFFLFFSANVCLPSQCTWQYLPAFIFFWHGFPARVCPWQSAEKDKVSQGSTIIPCSVVFSPDIFAGRDHSVQGTCAKTCRRFQPRQLCWLLTFPIQWNEWNLVPESAYSLAND